ncbi:MAG: helix-turn-helix domain-containing protein [Candidatus Omnitrophica bacterium]|nr:helix-turn-helix domain-containing protein [Candidatus Omnitrophota bacterium]MDD5661843.1 helix-turn-helix domain-containing protein [Candidatus Omnitrophota bacterium]
MADEKLLTVREVSLLLNISEKEVMNLAESRALPAYKVGGVYLRFKREQVIGYQKSSRPTSPKITPLRKSTARDKLSDFFYFNDFYILAALSVILLLIILLRG